LRVTSWANEACGARRLVVLSSDAVLPLTWDD